MRRLVLSLVLRGCGQWFKIWLNELRRLSGDVISLHQADVCVWQQSLQSMNSMKALLTKQVLVLLPGLPLFLATALCAGSATSLAGQPAPIRAGQLLLHQPRSCRSMTSLAATSLTTRLTVAGGATVNLSLGCSLQQDAAGRLRGAGATNIQVGNDPLRHSIASTGRSRVVGAKRRAPRCRRAGWCRTPAAGGKPSTISVQYNLQVNLGFLDGTARGQAKLAGAWAAAPSRRPLRACHCQRVWTGAGM